MFTLSVTMLSGAQLGFQYKSEAAMKPALNDLDDALSKGEPEFVAVQDDFTRKAMLKVEEIAAYFVCDLEASLVGAADSTMIQKRAEAKLMKRLNDDPALRFLMGSSPLLMAKQ